MIEKPPLAADEHSRKIKRFTQVNPCDLEIFKLESEVFE